jgi:hypothetical protein
MIRCRFDVAASHVPGFTPAVTWANKETFMRRVAAGIVVVMVTCGVAEAQDPSWPEAIADNSFFIEEAYNQDAGVVQHISGLYSNDGAHDFGFTQEWPLFGHAHQISYSVPYSWGGGENGIGDVMVNYRYQLRDVDDFAAIAPRLSLILPTGDEERGFGVGEPGLQVNLPISRRASAYLAWHVNVGATVFPDVDDLNAWHAGGSVVGLVSPKFNVLFEVLHVEGEGPAETTFNPGVRAAIDVGNLQIVPGFSVPITRSGGRSDAGAFFYLSFEHPFK